MGERRGSEIDRRNRRCERERERERAPTSCPSRSITWRQLSWAHTARLAQLGDHDRPCTQFLATSTSIRSSPNFLFTPASTLEMLAAKILHLKSLEPVARSQLLECQLTHVTDEVCFFLMIFEIHQLFSSW